MNWGIISKKTIMKEGKLSSGEIQEVKDECRWAVIRDTIGVVGFNIPVFILLHHVPHIASVWFFVIWWFLCHLIILLFCSSIAITSVMLKYDSDALFTPLRGVWDSVLVTVLILLTWCWVT
ncbi:MAG: hypothetical protein JJU29_23670 [Verrucomicrobia bacterium]|nr:hypothetical protein [Verrucomicrobiota bacterium]MCH8510112.1 hypothetical protein [Kiritimatiellia bacterium]